MIFTLGRKDYTSKAFRKVRTLLTQLDNNILYIIQQGSEVKFFAHTMIDTIWICFTIIIFNQIAYSLNVYNLLPNKTYNCLSFIYNSMLLPLRLPFAP